MKLFLKHPGNRNSASSVDYLRALTEHFMLSDRKLHVFSVIGIIFNVVVIIDSYRILRQRAENHSKNNHT